MRRKLENVLEKIEEALGEWAGVTYTYCPAWALPLKEAQAELLDCMEEALDD